MEDRKVKVICKIIAQTDLLVSWNLFIVFNWKRNPKICSHTMIISFCNLDFGRALSVATYIKYFAFRDHIGI